MARLPPGARTFVIIWAGQAVSLIGSAMNGFALGVWIYQRTGSVTQFALIQFFNTLPGVVMMPLAGPLIDRWNRRTALLLGAAGGGAASLAMTLLFQAGRLDLGLIALLVTASAAAQAFRWPALSASITLLVPPREVSRANGLQQLGLALSQVLAPIAAGALLGPIGLGGILWLNVASYVVAIATLLAVRIPAPPALAESELRAPLLAQFGDAWRYVAARRGLLSLLALFAGSNFAVGIVVALLTPMVLGFADARVLGTVVGAASGGLVVGGAVMTLWRGARRRIDGILLPMVAQALLLMVAGLRPSAAPIAAAAFLFLAAMPIISASSQAIWQDKVAPELQGRVFALRQMIALSALPLSRLVAGPLSDFVFEPLLAAGGPLAGSVGRVVGVGPGRGIALLFILLGVCYLVGVAVAWSSPRLRRVEEELPASIPAVANAAG